MRIRTWKAAALAAAVAVLPAGCAPKQAKLKVGGGLHVLAAFEPLIWAAGIVGGSDVALKSITPPGTEPHDTQVSAQQRDTIQKAAVIFYFGKGVQPEVEKAVAQGPGKAFDMLQGLTLLPSKEQGVGADPHVWLDPVLMKQIVQKVDEDLSGVDPKNKAHYDLRAAKAAEQLDLIDQAYRDGLKGCALKTLVTTHEAFGYLAARYGLTQLGLAGLTPEAEPRAARINQVRDLTKERKIDAIFYEETDEGQRIGNSVAGDLHLKALALDTFESDKRPNAYLAVMRQNLVNLRGGLRCPQ